MQKTDLSTAVFPAKVLLLGEHTILQGSRALALPLPRYQGQWQSGGNRQQQQRLWEWLDFLEQQEDSPINTTAFRLALEKGLFFDSTIPVGYGAGSSGTLCAALYQQYVENPEENLPLLRKELALLESFFHGSSSGIDPLIAYLQTALLLQPDGSIEPVDIPPLPDGHAFFLIDTGISRSASPLIEWFKVQSQTPPFAQVLQQALIPATNEAVDQLLQGQWPDFFHQLKKISQIQWEYLRPMIPEQSQAVWKDSLEDADTVIKLCGAGGGGFLLGYTRKKEAVHYSLI